MDVVLQRSARRKVILRLIPFLFLLYVVNILDRMNVNFAGIEMQKDLGMGESVFALGAGIFYIGYVFFEVPSNLILRQVGARRWISLVVIAWGLIACAMMLVRGPWSFYALRVLLGFAQAGFFPGIILYLTWWFPARDRAWTVAVFMAASPVTGVLGSPLSGAILQYMDHVGGLRGWQWVFVVEGAPAVVLGFVVLWYLTDRPQQARWLTESEREWLVSQINREEQVRETHHGMSPLQALADGRVWLLILLYFTAAVGANGLGFYMPKLIKGRFPYQNAFEIGLLTAIPYLAAGVGMVLNGTHSDRTGERRWHVSLPAFLAAVGLVLAVLLADSPVPYLLALTVAQVGISCMLPTFWTLPTAFLSGTAAAGGIALINSVGNLGGFAGPNILGQLQAVTDSYTLGLLAVAGTMFLGGVLALCVRHERVQEH